jgi:hypothetical protein
MEETHLDRKEETYLDRMEETYMHWMEETCLDRMEDTWIGRKSHTWIGWKRHTCFVWKRHARYNHHPALFQYQDQISQLISIICLYIYHITTCFGQLMRLSTGHVCIHIFGEL